ncbi:MAG: NAD(P)/FAD-dependent oxidoreductase [Clostridiales bacterium]|nr:NAD(P)/FAD-dependent oxidoreductase [Clostridiales bacterium]
MNTDFDAVVVGAGIAGLTSTAYLSKYGLKTILIEKGKKTGGLVSTFWHEGFAFDAGVRAFENSGIVLPMLKSFGIDLDYTSNPVSIGIKNDWLRLKSRDSLNDYTSLLISHFPQNASEIALIAGEIKKVMRYMDVIYGIENPILLDKINDLEYITKTLLPWLLKYQVNIKTALRLDEPVYGYLSRFSKNKALIDMIAQHFFKNTPTFFALSYFALYLDYYYPVGGTGVLPQKLTDYIRVAGAEILTHSPVTGLDSQKHEIQLNGGESYRYKKLIWAADQKTLYALTKSANSPKTEKQRDLVQNSSGGDSVLTFYLGVDLDKGYFTERCGPHSFYTTETTGLSSLPDISRPAVRGIEALLAWTGDYLERTTYEISCPALRDDTLAPEGKTGVIVSTLMDYELVRRFYDSGYYQSFKQYCTDKVLNILDSSIFPGIREKILFSLCGTPMTIERETGNTGGAITGWAFSGAQPPAENRLTKITRSVNTPINDVYQCGQWTFSPSGLPVSILTGKLAADAVRKKLGGNT